MEKTIGRMKDFQCVCSSAIYNNEKAGKQTAWQNEGYISVTSILWYTVWPLKIVILKNSNMENAREITAKRPNSNSIQMFIKLEWDSNYWRNAHKIVQE
jgi:hypothetical protein